MQLLLVFGGLFAIWLIWNALRLPGSLYWNAVRRARVERERLAALPTAMLVEEVRRSIRVQRWERFPSGNRILRDDEWSDSSLLDGLNKLYVELVDAPPTEFGPGSNRFEFHDCGLMSIVEILKKRTGNAS